MKVGRITILGPSGGGKGTQAKLLQEKFGWKHISVGSLFRKHIEDKTEIGKKADEYVQQGEWVPTPLTFKMIKPVLLKYMEKGFVLDGFPRLPDQPEVLANFLSENKVELDLAVHLDIQPKVIMARRKKAWEKGKSFYNQKRKDETMEAIQSRIDEYLRTINPILDYYQRKNKLVRIDGERPIEPIHQDIIKEINQRI